MKTSLKLLPSIGLVTVALILPFASYAGQYSTDAQRYSACKAQVMEQFDNIKSVKSRNMKFRQGVFHSKIKIVPNDGGDSSLVSCKIDKSDNITVNCINDTCSSQIVAAQ